MSRELLSMQNNTWQEVSGTEVIIDNCLGSKVRDLRVEGKTYQNVLDTKEIESVAERENNVLKIQI